VDLIECQVVQKKSTRDPSSEERSDDKQHAAINILQQEHEGIVGCTHDDFFDTTADEILM
jgi:hypothetical protein